MSINSLINQQTGTSKWNHYDIAIKRLICRKSEEYKWIFPNLAWGAADTPIFACKFALVKGYEHILALANEDGKIAVFDTYATTPRLGGNAHNNAIFDLAWMPKKMKLVSASGDHTAGLFDVTNGDIQLEQVFQGHTRSLKTVACRVDDDSVFATGGRDGTIMIWDARATKSDVLCCTPDLSLPLTHSHPSQTRRVKSRSGKIQPVVSGSSSVTGLVYQDYYTLMSCGAGDGLIKVWDMRKNYFASNRAPIPKHTLPYAGSTLRNGFSNLLLNSNATKLYANCLDNVIYCYNVATYHPEPIMTYIGHKNSTFYVKSSLSPDERYLLSGSSDNNAYIWKTTSSNPMVKLEGHEAEVTCVAWCQESSDAMLVTCSDDLRHKIWRIGPEVVPSFWENKYSSRAQFPVQPQTPAKSKKRPHEANENLWPHEESRTSADKFRPNGYKCSHSQCRKMYRDEYLMVYRNKGMREQTEKKQKMETTRKRRYFNDLTHQNQPTTSSNVNEGPSLKKTKDDSDYYDYTDDELSDESPTSNLPNFVDDGLAPHLNKSPLKTLEKDWLTKLRMERLSTKDLQELSTPSSPKVRKIASANSPSSKPSTKSSDNPGPSSSSSSQNPLLKFFKFTNSSNNSGQQYRAKSPNLVTSSPKSSQPSQES